MWLRLRLRGSLLDPPIVSHTTAEASSAGFLKVSLNTQIQREPRSLERLRRHLGAGPRVLSSDSSRPKRGFSSAEAWVGILTFAPHCIAQESVPLPFGARVGAERSTTVKSLPTGHRKG